LERTPLASEFDAIIFSREQKTGSFFLKRVYGSLTEVSRLFDYHPRSQSGGGGGIGLGDLFDFWRGSSYYNSYEANVSGVALIPARTSGCALNKTGLMKKKSKKKTDMFGLIEKRGGRNRGF
jgi:hypothetical protein